MGQSAAMDSQLPGQLEERSGSEDCAWFLFYLHQCSWMQAGL